MVKEFGLKVKILAPNLINTYDSSAYGRVVQKVTGVGNEKGPQLPSKYSLPK